jgi:Tfp pilus assembly protein PilO
MTYPTRYFALVLLLIAVPVSAWAIAYRPMNEAVQTVTTEIRERTSKLINYDEVNAQYREMRSIAQSLDVTNKKVASNIPRTHNADQWLESASDAALEYGLVVESVTTAGERIEGEYLVMPVDLKVQGSFSSVYKLVQHLEGMRRVTNINQLSITRKDENNVNARFVVHLIFWEGGSKWRK